MAEKKFSIRFRGVRGSIPTSGPDTQYYGGNTSCVEVRCDDTIILLDAGSGIRKAGITLQEECVGEATILLTHAHWDHVIGLPFFKPLYCSGIKTTIWSGLTNVMSTRDIVAELMRRPFLPMSPDIFRGDVHYVDFKPGEELAPAGNVKVRTGPLNHPGGAVGYRLEYGDRVLAYITDTEHDPGTLDSNVLDLIAGADLMIYDCTYTEAELPLYKSYGHSTWEQGVKLCKAAGTRGLALFHHYPSRTDSALREIEQMAKTAFTGAFAARDDMTIEL